jgi:hypothetical protein
MQTQMITDLHQRIAMINVRTADQVIALNPRFIINMSEQRTQTATAHELWAAFSKLLAIQYGLHFIDEPRGTQQYLSAAIRQWRWQANS